MWKCKKCGNDRFYQPFRGKLLIMKADKKQEIIECDDSCNSDYGKFHCDNCNKTGWTLDEVAEWEEEDSFIPDRRVVENKNRAVKRTLKNITDNEEEQANIREAIEKEMFNFKDRTYKTVCDNLRNLGYTVVEGK